MQISINSLILAMYAVHRDIRHHESINNSTLSDVEREDAGQYVLDLSVAYGELCCLYRLARQTEPDFPSLEQLMNDIDKSA